MMTADVRDGCQTTAAGTTMRAVVQSAYGTADVLSLEDVAMPTMGEDQVLVRVHGAALNAGDLHLLSGKPYLVRLMGFGLFRPKVAIAGLAMAGRVEAVGLRVTQFRPGDEVYGEIPRGAFAEYACVSETLLAHKSSKLTFEQAAALPVAATSALQALRDVAQLTPGQRVLINGAAGGVGTFSVQIAKSMGALVTAVGSTSSLPMLRDLGADEAIDYTQDDFTLGGRRFDVMLDLVGNRTLAECRSVLKPEGRYIAAAGQMKGEWLGPVIWMVSVLMASLFRSQKMAPFVATARQQDLEALNELVDRGAVKPVIECTYELRDVPRAMHDLATRQTEGKHVLSV